MIGDTHLNDKQAADYMNSVKNLGSRPGLGNITRLCGLLDNPQDGLNFIHVAGTNGKGSTCTMLASVLTSAGYKTGLFLSPHLLEYRDSLTVNGVMMSREDFADTVEAVKRKADHMADDEKPTEFEILTAVAFLWFYRQQCDAVVLETGMGGRLDATNIVKTTLASVITPVSLDHTDFLGDTLEKIAVEKCGIIKPGAITVSAPNQDIVVLSRIEESAREKQNALYIPDMQKLRIGHAGLDGTDFNYRDMPLHVPLAGRHQVENAVTAVETLYRLRQHTPLKITDEAIITGLQNARLPVRQEVLLKKPLILLDGAHNADGARTLTESMREFFLGMRVAVIMGMLRDKDYMESVRLIAGLCGRFIAVRPQNPRALESDVLAKAAGSYCADVSAAEDDYKTALAEALDYAGKEGVVVICGSLYLAGPMRAIALENACISKDL